MHPHFFHWHGQVELKPDVAVLEPRWKAAEEFANNNHAAADVNGLLRIAASGKPVDELATRFAEALIVAEPTFPPSRNNQLLGVMACAALYSQLENSSNVADAISIGLRAASFTQPSENTAYSDLFQRAMAYLSSEAERMRPAVASSLDIASSDIDSAIAKFSAASQNGQTAEFGKHFDTLGKFTIALSKRVAEQDRVFERLAEETQFLWWIVNQSSPTLKIRRSKISVAAYTLVSAEEAATRVGPLPPSASAESLIREAMSQCRGDAMSPVSLTNLLGKCTMPTLPSKDDYLSPQITPILGALKKAVGTVRVEQIEDVALDPERKLAPVDLAIHHFWERSYLSAIRILEKP